MLARTLAIVLALSVTVYASAVSALCPDDAERPCVTSGGLPGIQRCVSGSWGTCSGNIVHDAMWHDGQVR
jgi:hypothetical protein